MGSLSINKKDSHCRGMILSEILLAGVIISLALASVVIVIGSLQSMLINAQNGFEAQLIARKEIALAHIKDFDGIASFEKTDGIFTTNFSVAYRNTFSTNISADVSWYEGSFKKHRGLADQIVDWKRAKGAIDCDWLDKAEGDLKSVNFGFLNIDESNLITGITVLGNFVYVSADSATSSLPDLYVIDVSDIQNPKIIGHLNTGPGIASIAGAGHYIFAANAGSYQMQIIDVANPTNPILVAQAKLPGVVVSGSGGFGQSVHFFDNKMYIGLIKNTGPEFYILDVGNPQSPVALGSYEIGSTVNDIDVQGQRAFVVAPGQTSVFSLDISNPEEIIEITQVSFEGWQTQGAKSVGILGPRVTVGRNLGGFYSPYPELMILNRDDFSSTIASLKIGASVVDILSFNNYSYMTTNNVGAAFQILRNDTLAITKTSALSSRGVALTCNNEAMYVVTQNNQDFFHIFTLP